MKSVKQYTCKQSAMSNVWTVLLCVILDGGNMAGGLAGSAFGRATDEPPQGAETRAVECVKRMSSMCKHILHGG